MKRLNSILALLLVLLLPIQGFAVVANSLSHQATSSHHEIQAGHEEGHACHQTVKHHSHSDYQKEKNHCASICSQLNMVAINLAISTEIAEFTPSYMVASSEAYLSISLPKFQRPPIQIS